MSEVRTLIEALVERGIDPIEAAEIITRAAIHGAATARPPRSSAAERQARYRERKRASQTVTDRHQPSPTVTKHNKPSQTVTRDAPSLDKEGLPQTPSQEINPSPKNPPKGGQKRGSRLPPDWELSEENRRYAAEKNLSPAQIEREASQFRDYWLAKPGKDGVKLDWDATWRTWVRNVVKWQEARAGPESSRTPNFDRLRQKRQLEQQTGEPR